MMDTEALWQAIAAYGNARWRGYSHEIDAEDNLSEIKAILNRSEAETRELLATNERLVDEVAELKQRVAGLEANEKVLLAQVQGDTQWREKIINASVSAYGESAIRYKFSLTKSGKCMNTFPREIDGRWFALTPAEDDGHIGHIARIHALTGENAELKAKLTEKAYLLRGCYAQTVPDGIPLNIIRKWPDGFNDRLQHVWLDVVSFIPSVKLYDLQRVLAEFGLRMEVYEDAPAAPAPPLDLGVMELAESVRLIGPESRMGDLHDAIQRFHDLIVVNASIKAARHFADGLAQQKGASNG